MSYDYLLVERHARVTTIILNRPEVMNALHPDMHFELQDAFDAFAADDAQRICVLTGAGDRAFCAGSDLKAASSSRGYPKNGYGGIIARFDLHKPLIAAVNGICLGGGFELALSCDIIIASDNAAFGFPEPKVGAIALAGGIHRLVRQIGLKQAMGYLLTTRRFSAAEGERLGVVNEVVPQAEMAATVERWCDEILACGPVAIQATKEAAMRGLDEPGLRAAIKAQQDYPGYQAWRNSEDVKEGPRAFAEKRAPVWTGR